MATAPTKGSCFFIGPEGLVSNDTLSFTEVSGIVDLGEFGLSAAVVETTPIKGHTTRHKGTPDYGTMEIIADRDIADPGQLAMIAAADIDQPFAFRVDLNDAPSSSGTPSTYYFAGEVMSVRNTMGEANNMVRTTFTVSVNTKPDLVAAA